MMLPYEDALAVALSGKNYESDAMRFLTVTKTTIEEIAVAIAQAKPVGFTVFALEQTKGRGGGIDRKTGKLREWVSAKGNLLVSFIIDANITFPKECEFVAMLAVGEICAALIPRGQVTYKFANDILVNGDKIAGGLFLPHPQAAGSPPVASMSLGVNLVVSPPANMIREESIAKGGTCLKDHGVDIDIAGFMRLFDRRFAELRQIHRQKGFTAILQHIGFADSQGIVTLRANQGDVPIIGTYAGFDAIEIGPDTYANYICLKSHDGSLQKLAFTDYHAQALIHAGSAIKIERRLKKEAPHV